MLYVVMTETVCTYHKHSGWVTYVWSSERMHAGGRRVGRNWFNANESGDRGDGLDCVGASKECIVPWINHENIQRGDSGLMVLRCKSWLRSHGRSIVAVASIHTSSSGRRRAALMECAFAELCAVASNLLATSISSQLIGYCNTQC